MNRRDVITSSGAAALCAILPAGGSLASPLAKPAIHAIKRLRLACDWPQAAGGTFDAALDVARTIEIALGNCAVEVVPAGSTAADADISFGNEHAHAVDNSALALIAGLPGRFALPPLASAHWLTTSGERLWQEAAQRTAQVIPVYAGCEGTRPTLWSRHEIANFSGLKTAGAAGLCAELLSAAGATRVDLPVAEWVPALTAGTIDAVHVAGLEDALVLGLPRHARYCLTGAIAAHGGPLALRIPAGLWHALPDHVRQHLRARVTTAGSRHTARMAQNDCTLRNAMTEAFGLRVLEQVPPNLQTTIDRVAEAIMADCAGRDTLSSRIGGASMAQHLVRRKSAPPIS